MKIAIVNDQRGCPFEGDMYYVDLSRRFEGFVKGDLICHVCPFGPTQLPLQLEIAITTDGRIKFRSWKFIEGEINPYLHTDEISEAEYNKRAEGGRYVFESPFIPTEEQIDTVNGLFSGRIKFEGLKIAVGASVQDICPINVASEEAKLNKKIYLS